MLTDITLGQYYPGTSVLHRLDPRTKIIGTVLVITGIFLAEEYAAYLAVLAFLSMVISLSSVPLAMYLRSLRPLWLIIVFTLGIHIFTTPGTSLYQLGPLAITQEGLRQGILMSVRLLFLISISSALTFTTSPIALTDGIERLLNPFKRIGLPAHELAMMMTIALRFIPTLLEETDRIIKAQTARGADFSSGGILKRAKSLVPILVPLFISAFRRADDLAIAMEARCYRGGQNRTRMKELRLTTQDFASFLLITGLIAALAWLKWS